MFLADDLSLAQDVIAAMKPSSLDHHPAGWLARNVADSEWATVEDIAVFKEAMACELQEGALEPYMRAVESKGRLPGHCNWAPPFMLC